VRIKTKKSYANLGRVLDGSCHCCYYKNLMLSLGKFAWQDLISKRSFYTVGFLLPRLLSGALWLALWEHVLSSAHMVALLPKGRTREVSNLAA
jgi:hypothetical protein